MLQCSGDWLLQLEWWMSPPEDPCPLAPPHPRRRGNTSSLLTALLHSLPTGVVSLQQVDQLSPPSTGGLRHMPLSFLVVFLRYLTSKDGIGWWQEVPPEETQQCRMSLVVILHLV